MIWSQVSQCSVEVTDPFWKEWQRVIIHQSLPHQWQKCEETGRTENFRRAARRETGPCEGFVFNDTDIHKWVEAAAYASRLDPDSPNKAALEEAKKLISEAQLPDGYINTHYQLTGKERWSVLRNDHEMYTLGHLIEAGCGAFEATGDRTLLEVSLKAASCVAAEFGPNKRLGYCGHQEIELALCRLSDVTGDEQWRQLARWMITSRGTRPSPLEEEVNRELAGQPAELRRRHFFMKDGIYDGRYFQDDLPLEDQDTPVGHAVRAMYYYCGAHDSFPEGLPSKLQSALSSIWRRLIDRRTYVTGGIGSSAANEGFTEDYDLPNLKAYAETCAGIGLIFWASRMARGTGSAECLDVLERALYNAVLSGLGEDGRAFFYDNPLESLGGHLRQPWFSCVCCPPNVARLILSLGGYVASHSPGKVAIGLLFSSRIKAQGLVIEVETAIPWSGTGEVRIIEAPDEPREILIRQPGWAPEGSIQGFSPAGQGWLSLTKTFRPGESFALDFSFTPRLLAGSSRVHANLGRRAAANGPLIYCLEECDLGAPVSLFTLQALDGTTPLTGLGTARQGILSRGTVEAPIAAAEGPPPAHRAAHPTLIPYYSWANRTEGSMQVWLRGASADPVGAQ